MQTPTRQERGPVQARSLKRIEAACEAAEKLLVELGPDKTSIPEIAAAAGVPRATIYQYFPDRYALFASLAETQFRRITEQVDQALTETGKIGWRGLVSVGVDAAAAFYNANEVAAILLLLGPFGSADRAAHVEKDKVLAGHFRTRLGLGESISASEPDRIELAIQIAFACLRYGYIHDGIISPEISAEASRAATAYIEPFMADRA